MPCEETNMSRLPVRIGNRIMFLEKESITRVEADGNYVNVEADGRSWVLRKSLVQMEATLNDEMFLRISRSSIVNTERIREIRYLESGHCDVVLADGRALRCSRRFRQGLKRRLLVEA
jgi:two-component system, LytTR family, response regulator